MELKPEEARVALEICDLMQGPIDPGGVALVVRMASYLRPLLEDAFTAAGLDPEDIDLPEMPKLRPGDLHQPN